MNSVLLLTLMCPEHVLGDQWLSSDILADSFWYFVLWKQSVLSMPSTLTVAFTIFRSNFVSVTHVYFLFQQPPFLSIQTTDSCIFIRVAQVASCHIWGSRVNPCIPQQTSPHFFQARKSPAVFGSCRYSLSQSFKIRRGSHLAHGSRFGQRGKCTCLWKAPWSGGL